MPALPAPDKVSASLPMLTPAISSVAPEATVVPPTLLPRPAAWDTTKVPRSTVVAPS